MEEEEEECIRRQLFLLLLHILYSPFFLTFVASTSTYKLLQLTLDSDFSPTKP
jgi:hypothetical protein